ncbi:DUF4240 domain-containing protein [Kitasatospora sp. NPDC057904]|uniref:DUF4240 domain-containing protein n=1 Tax=unclassified Kitasatospora TaxID=2633591 RepID=UPI0036DB7C8D
MDEDTWWALIEEARAAVGSRADDRDPPDDPLPEALTDVLVRLSREEIVEFAVRHVEARQSAYRWELWGAADLIEGGCSDDGFMDFRDGLVLLGRDTFTRALADPDTLADLPVITRMSRDEAGWIGYESLSYPIADAYQRITGETESLDEGIGRALEDMAHPEDPAGERWKFDDDEETRSRLPRLAELFLD